MLRDCIFINIRADFSRYVKNVLRTMKLEAVVIECPFGGWGKLWRLLACRCRSIGVESFVVLWGDRAVDIATLRHQEPAILRAKFSFFKIPLEFQTTS